MLPPTLRVEVDGARFAISSADARWIDWMSRLWGDYLVEGADDAAGSFEIVPDDAEPDRWTLLFNGDIQATTDDPWLIAQQIRYRIVLDAISLSKLVSLHAAVVARESSTIVIAGASGAGKSTLALDLVARGWELVTDDLARIDAQGRILPFSAPVSVKDKDKWPAYAQMWEREPWLRRPERAFLVDAHSLMAKERISRVPTLLVFPTFARGMSLTTKRLSGAAAVVQLAELTPRLDPPRLGILRRAFADATALRAEHGGQLADLLDAAGDALL